MIDIEQRLAELWRTQDAYPDDEFRAAIADAVSGLPDDDPVRHFELGCAHDSTGDPARAVEHYRRARELGLTGIRRRRSSVQLASSLRNLGRPEEAVEILRAELHEDSDELDSAVRAFLALALTDVGREREAVSLALRALVPHLPRYQRSLDAYARALVADAPPPDQRSLG